MTEDERRCRMEKALAYGGGTHRISDVAELIRDGRAQWWNSPSGDGMIVTEVNAYPLVKMIRYWLIFGSLKECLALEDEINEWAISEGCTLAVATGRKGWERAARSTGWKPWLPNFQKSLVP